MKKLLPLLILLLLLIVPAVRAQTSPGTIQPPGVTTALNAVTTNTNSSPLNVRIYGAVALDVTITGGTVNVTLKGRIDTSSTYRTLLGYNDADGTSLSTITASGSYTFGTAGKEDVEVFTTSISGATVTVKVRPIPSVGKAFHDGDGGGGSGSGSVTSVSGVDTNGFTFNITNPTTTPSITLTQQNAVADGSTKGIASFTAADFNASSGNISLDYTNAQKATGSVPGFLAAADWTTFNNKQASLGFTPVGGSGSANTVAIFTAGTTLGNSSITDDGTTVSTPSLLSLGGTPNPVGILTTATTTVVGDIATIGNGTTGIFDDVAQTITFSKAVVAPTIGPSDTRQHTLPNVASDTFALLAASQAFTNKSYNGLTINSTTGTLAIANGKTATVSNTLAFAGTDGSTLNVGAGGTLGSNAFTSTAYVPTSTTVNSKALSGNVTLGLASSDFSNQGTTTTILHGNAAGNPSFGQVVNADITNSTIDLTAKVTGLLPAANIGVNVLDQSVYYAADAGSNDTYAITLSPVPAGYVTGGHYRFKANTANTGAATLNINSLGAKTIKKAAGGITTDLADNDIRGGQFIDLVYDGTNMQMQSLLGNAPSGGGTPGGSDTQVQYNNAGAFGGISGLTTNGSTTLVQTSNSAAAFESGPNGSTNPIFRLVNNVASAATGLSITGNAAGSGVTLAALSSGSNEDIILSPKGTGAVSIPTTTHAALKFLSGTGVNFGASVFITNSGGQFWVENNAETLFAPIVVSQLYLNSSSNTALAQNAAGVVAYTLGSGTTGNGWFVWGGSAYLASDQTNATATLASTTLSVTLIASRKYTFKAILYVSDDTAAEGVKADFGGGTATATNFRTHCTGFDTALGISTQVTSLTGTVSAGTFTGSGMIECHGSFEVNSGGTFIPRFAQNSHVIGTLTLFRGSHLQVFDTP